MLQLFIIYEYFLSGNVVEDDLIGCPSKDQHSLLHYVYNVEIYYCLFAERLEQLGNVCQHTGDPSDNQARKQYKAYDRHQVDLHDLFIPNAF